jgi:thiamine monophosphate kinase
MGEFELIRHYFAAAPCAQGGEGVALGIGDDCALLASPGEQLAISTDTLVAGVHFPLLAIRCCSASARWPWRSATWRPWAPLQSALPSP